jgi:hypothetical protein
MRRTAILPLLTWSRLLPALGFLLYALFLAHYMGVYAGGADSSGYLNNARLLAQGRVTVPMHRVPDPRPETLPSYTDVPLGFFPNQDHVTLNPIYPTGLPLLIAGMAQVAGWAHGPRLAMGLQALLGLWLVYRLARIMGLGAGLAWLGTLLLAVSPVYILMSLQAMSDMPALVWVTAAVYYAWISRDRTWLALPAGMALAMAVLVRPSDLLAAVPVALALGFSLRRWLLLIVGGLPGAIFLSVFNLAAYGSIFTTGYGSVASEFSRQVVPSTLVHYATWLPVLLTPLIVLALGLPALRRRRPLPTVLLAVWALIFPAFYVFNIHLHEFWWYLRFLLPSFPPLIVSALLVTDTLIARWRLPLRPWWLAMAGALTALNGMAWTCHFGAHHVAYDEKVYSEASAWMREHLPANAVVATMQTSGALFYYTDYPLVRWDMISPADFQRIAAACTAAGRPIYAALFPFEIEDADQSAFQKHLNGHWTQIGAVRYVSIWRYDSPI